jgi:hypothetical protein
MIHSLKWRVPQFRAHLLVDFFFARCFRRALSFTSFHFWLRLSVLDLAEGDIGKQLSELIGVARAFLASGASRQIGPC